MFRTMIASQVSALEQTLANAPTKDEALMREARADLEVAVTKALQALNDGVKREVDQ